MKIWERIRNLIVHESLTMMFGSKIKIQATPNAIPTEIDLAELAALDSIGAADLAKIDGVVNGTAAAGKALVADANIDISGMRHVGLTGTLTTGAIAGADASLDIDGKDDVAGGSVNVTGGDSSGGNNNGGNVVLTPGAKNGTGIAGVVIERGVKLVKQGAPHAATVSAQLTAAQLATGIVTVNQAAGGASAQQLPTAADMDLGFPAAAADDAFDFSVINISAVAAEDASVTTAAGWTLVGNMDVASNAAATDKSAGRFRARKTGAGAWTLYRLS